MCGMNLLRVARRVLLMLSFAAVSVTFAAELKPADAAPARTLVLKTLEGAVHDLAQYRGKVVLIVNVLEPGFVVTVAREKLAVALEGNPVAVSVMVTPKDERLLRLIVYCGFVEDPAVVVRLVGEAVIV